MKLSELKVARKSVEGYPQLTVKEPTITEVAEITKKFTDFKPTDDELDATAEVASWFLTRFVGDENGDPLEDVDDPQKIKDVLPSSLLLACLRACLGRLQTGESDVPE